MSQVPVFFDNLLSLPMPLMIGFLVVYWLLFAAIVHRFLVPWIAGRHGQKLGRLEAEVPAQIGLAFGLLISFIAIPVWDQHNRAEDAARTEAAAYREMQQAVGDSARERWSGFGGAKVCPLYREDGVAADGASIVAADSGSAAPHFDKPFTKFPKDRCAQNCKIFFVRLLKPVRSACALPPTDRRQRDG